MLGLRPADPIFGIKQPIGDLSVTANSTLAFTLASAAILKDSVSFVRVPTNGPRTVMQFATTSNNGAGSRVDRRDHAVAAK